MLPLNSITITKKDTLQSSRFQLVLANVCIRWTTKYLQVIILRWLARPHLLWCLTIYSCRWRAINQVACCSNCLPKDSVVTRHERACNESSPIVSCSYVLLLHSAVECQLWCSVELCQRLGIISQTLPNGTQCHCLISNI